MESFRYLGWTVKWEKDQRERGKIILIKGLNYKFFKLLRFVHNFSCSELWFIYVTKWLKFPARKLSTLGDPGNLMDFLTALHVTASNDARNIEWCHHLDDYPFRSWNPQMYNWSFTLCILPEIPLPLLVDTRSTHSPNSHLMFWAKKPETPYILVSKSRSRTRNSSHTSEGVCIVHFLLFSSPCLPNSHWRKSTTKSSIKPKEMNQDYQRVSNLSRIRWRRGRSCGSLINGYCH